MRFKFYNYSLTIRKQNSHEKLFSNFPSCSFHSINRNDSDSTARHWPVFNFRRRGQRIPHKTRARKNNFYCYNYFCSSIFCHSRRQYYALVNNCTASNTISVVIHPALIFINKRSTLTKIILLKLIDVTGSLIKISARLFVCTPITPCRLRRGFLNTNR